MSGRTGKVRSSKVPNVPAARIRATFSRFLETAGEGGTTDKRTMRPFVAGINGGRPSRLEQPAD